MTQALTLVINKEEKVLDGIAERLQKAQQYIATEEQQLELLQGYERDYQHKIQQDQGSWTASMIQRYRGFTQQLHVLIRQQQDKIDFARQGLEPIRQELTRQQHKLSVLKDLEQRQEDDYHRYLEGQEQKLLDERATQYYYHRS